LTGRYLVHPPTGLFYQVVHWWRHFPLAPVPAWYDWLVFFRRTISAEILHLISETAPNGTPENDRAAKFQEGWSKRFLESPIFYRILNCTRSQPLCSLGLPCVQVEETRCCWIIPGYFFEFRLHSPRFSSPHPGHNRLGPWAHFFLAEGADPFSCQWEKMAENALMLTRFNPETAIPGR